MKWSKTDSTHWMLAPDDELAIHGTIATFGGSYQFYAYLGGGDYTAGFRSSLKLAKRAVEAALGVAHEPMHWGLTQDPSAPKVEVPK